MKKILVLIGVWFVCDVAMASNPDGDQQIREAIAKIAQTPNSKLNGKEKIYEALMHCGIDPRRYLGGYNQKYFIEATPGTIAEVLEYFAARHEVAATLIDCYNSNGSKKLTPEDRDQIRRFLPMCVAAVAQKRAVDLEELKKEFAEYRRALRFYNCLQQILNRFFQNIWYETVQNLDEAGIFLRLQNNQECSIPYEYFRWLCSTLKNRFVLIEDNSCIQNITEIDRAILGLKGQLASDFYGMPEDEEKIVGPLLNLIDGVIKQYKNPEIAEPNCNFNSVPQITIYVLPFRNNEPEQKRSSPARFSVFTEGISTATAVKLSFFQDEREQHKRTTPRSPLRKKPPSSPLPSPVRTPG